MGAEAVGQVITTPYQQEVADWFDTQMRDPVNQALGDVDGTYHHHYGLGAYDPTVWDAPAETRDERIIHELHRLECAQAEFLVDQFGGPGPQDHLLDAGCGRGATSFLAHRRFGCRVDGVSISRNQVDFANDQAAGLHLGDRVRFHFRNMLDTGFADGEFQVVWNNESTMYVDLHELFGELARVLRVGGRYVCVTGAYNDALGDKSPAVAAIDQHYSCEVHARSAYFQALAARGLVPITVADLTEQAIPYWQLRERSSVTSGVEAPFLTAYRERSLHYLLIVADRA